jgi:putative ABC transport system permease protein
VYVPTEHYPDSNLYFVARVSGSPESVIPPVRALIQELDPEAAVTIYSLAERIASSEAAVAQRFGIALMGCLAAVAALLAIVGIYGVLAYSVSRRSHEIGVRMALGAGVPNVVGSVVGRGLWMAAIGCAAGLGLAVAASRVLGSLLYQISPTDPATMAGVAALVAVATVAASYVPARRATRVNPVEALREDG